MGFGELLGKEVGEFTKLGMFGSGMGDIAPMCWVSDLPFLLAGVVEWGERWAVGLSISSSESPSISKAGFSGWKSSSGTLESQASMTGSFQGRQSFITHIFLYSSTVS